ncbi:MAG: S8 family serine peptidase [Acidobacteria bacterium]|nr:S8 family serine peptidase [Acidobacteriota bacterium]
MRRHEGRGARLTWLLVVACAAAAALFHSARAASRPTHAGPVRLLIDKDGSWAQSAAELSRSGMRVVDELDSYVVAEFAADPGAAALRAKGLHVRRRLADGVHLRRRTVTRDSFAAASPAAGLHLVRFSRPVRGEWIDAVRSLPGSRVLMALPGDAYVVWLPDAAARKIRLLPAPVDFAGILPPRDRVSPELDGLEGPIDVTLAFPDSPAGAAAAAAARDRATSFPIASPRVPGMLAVTLTIARGALDEIAAWPELVWAEPYRAPVRHDEIPSLITAGLVAGGRPLSPQYRAWLAFHGLDDLSSTIVQIVDTGIDTGGLGASHPALAGRLAFARDETGEGMLDDCVGHGTHLAGIIAGDPPLSVRLSDSDGYELGLGVAPTARVGSSRIFDCAGNGALTRSLSEILEDAWRRGARISNNSWGTGGANYDLLAREFDGLVRDVDGDPTNGDQPMIVIASVGNRGNLGPFTIDSPGLAKNVVGVGGTESFRPDGTDGCGFGPDEADDADQVRRTSGRGPTTDGRLKPDLVAPASHIFSLVSQSPLYTGLGLCDTYRPASQRLYTWTGGSSQGTAHVSGAAVLAVEDYRKAFGRTPSPAMVRSMLVASAKDLGGSPAGGGGLNPHRPGTDQGWGRVNVSGLVGRRHREAFDQADLLTSSGQTVVKGPFRAADANQPVTIALSWTDAPGTPAGDSWVNDLDLEVASDGVTWLGNNFDASGNSLSAGSADERDNTEVVRLAPGLRRSFFVRVVATSLTGDGVPSAPGVTDQDFALYLDNVASVTRRGEISLGSDAYACGAVADVVVADADLAGEGRVSASATSATEPAPEQIVLDEDPPGSGVFRGGIPIRSGAAARDGALEVADGETFTLAYDDADAGAGGPARATATAVVRCSIPLIDGVRVEKAGTDHVVVAWRTDRAADSVVVGDRGVFASDPTPVLDHRVVVDRLQPCSSYRFHVASSDAAGSTGIFPASGTLTFSTAADKRITLFSDDFESGAGRWTHGGAHDEWELGAPHSGPGHAFSGTRAWATRLASPYSAKADAFLESPPIDLRDLTAPRLTFNHSYDLPFDGAAGSPQDGAWLELSIDDGATWSAISPVRGYPVAQGPDNPYLPPGSGVFAASSLGWLGETFDLSPFEGNTVRIRFRLWRDPASTRPPGAGWYVDDVTVSAVAPCHRGTLILDAPAYGCSQVARVTLSDSDLDQDPMHREVASAVVTGPDGSVGILLNETGPDTAMFAGAVSLSGTAAPGKLSVAPGDSFTVRYTDQDQGDGTSHSVDVSAEVPDCTPPAPPSQLVAEPDGVGRLRLRWSDPADADLGEIRVHYDSDAPGPAYSGQGAAEGASPVRAEVREQETLLSSLSPCVPRFLALSAVDVYGNESGFSNEAIGVPPGVTACNRAALTIAPATPVGCGQTPVVTVEDGNADLDRKLAGRVTVLASSPADPSPLMLTLTETSPASGRFVGDLPLSGGFVPGRLHVAAGDTVTVTYVDLDAGGGVAETIRREIPVDDCTPPIISGVRLFTLGFGSLRLAWETDEPASSTVTYGPDPTLGLSAAGAPATRHHEIPISGLAPCTTVYFRVASVDARGNAAEADDGGAPFHEAAGRTSEVFFDDLESGTSGWSHGGIFDEWAAGLPVDGPGGAFSGTHAWGIDLTGPYERGADEYLVSPDVDLVGLDAATLTFMHWYDIFTSDPGQGLDDGGWVEVSIDGGATWTYVTPEGGYPDIIANNSDIPFASRVYAGTTPAWEQATFRLDAFAGHHVRIRFHLYQDSIDALNVPGAGWYLDDVRVVGAAACRRGRLRLDAPGRDCGGAPIEVRLWDTDLDADPNAPDTATARVVSPSDPDPLDVALVETAPHSGAFFGVAPFGPAGGPGQIRVREGDVVTATYLDADDGTGAPAAATDRTRVIDCTPPVISSVRSRALTSSSAVVEWDTDEPSTSDVMLQPGGAVFSSAGLTAHHAVTVSGLAPCGVYRVQVASADRGGNRSTDDGGGLYALDAPRDVTVLSEGFESGAPGWTHAGVHDLWQVGRPLSGPFVAYRGSAVAATNLAGNYLKDRERQRTESWLVSPWFNLDDASAATLTIHHDYEFTRDTGGDGGTVEVWFRNQWMPIAPTAGYPGAVHTDRSEAATPAFTNLSLGYVESKFDLSPFAGGPTRVRFRAIVDNGTPAAAPGWYLDEITVTALAGCRAGRLELDREAYACGPTSAGVLLADTDLNSNPALREAAVVQVSAASASFPLVLFETTEASGIFEGRIDLAPAPASGSLAVGEGDTLTVTYQDADDGTGAPRAVTASASIADCRPPKISRVRTTREDDGTTIRLEWATDEPSTSEATVAPSGAVPESVSDVTLTTEHTATFPGLPECTPAVLSLASADDSGNRSEIPSTDPRLATETTRRRAIFHDDMEAADPGWVPTGKLSEWRRGVPTVGPPGAFSGALVWGTDLTGQYEAGSDQTLISPEIDLRQASSATLTFWHYYDIFAIGSPNAEDDGAWVEVETPTSTSPVYIKPVGGYPNTIDRDSNPPIAPGSGVYAGRTGAWRKAVFDLSPFAGTTIRLGFRLRSDVLGGGVGFGWYIDDVDVTEPEACFPAPRLSSVAAAALGQGASGGAVELRGAGFRDPITLDAGPGVSFRSVKTPAADSVTALVDVDPGAPATSRALTLTNPDGQSATLASALVIAPDRRRADVNGSGAVDADDLAAIVAAFGSFAGEPRYRAPADLNADGAVDGIDLAILASVFGTSVVP